MTKEIIPGQSRKDLYGIVSMPKTVRKDLKILASQLGISMMELFEGISKMDVKEAEAFINNK
jgi:uncharacterized protein YrrD